MLSDEEKQVVDYLIFHKYENSSKKEDMIDKVIEIIEKQSKEIEELKEKGKYITKETVEFVNSHYIRKEESEQKEKKAYIDGTNVADKLCNKKWKDKIKEKIEELEKQDRENRMSSNYLVIPVLQSLLEKE